MEENSATVARRALKRATLRWTVAQLVVVSALPWIVLAIIGVSAAVKPPLDGSSVASAFAGWMDFPARQLGVQAVRDAGWILPSLLALLISIYVGDYEQSRRAERSGQAGTPDSNENASRVWLAFAGVVAGALAIDYLALSIATVATGRISAGHLVGIVTVGVWIPAFGIVVGQFNPVRIADQIEFNVQASERVTAKLDRTEPQGRSAARPRTIIALWLASPFLIVALTLLIFLGNRSTVGFEILQVLTFAAIFNMFFGLAMYQVRAFQVDAYRDKSALIPIVCTFLAPGFLLFVVILAFAVEKWPYRIAPAISAIIMVAFAIGWAAPFSLAAAAAGPRWLTSRAIVEIRHASLMKESAKLAEKARVLEARRLALEPEIPSAHPHRRSWLGSRWKRNGES